LISGKTIFLSPLDWGLGHATRCVPIIKELLLNNNKIIIGITPLTTHIFGQEFPTLEKVDVPAYNITYSSFLPAWLSLLLNGRRILNVLKDERNFLEKLVSKHKIDLVISDNRFGLYTKKAHCIFITHQVFLKAPFLSFLFQRVNKKYLLNFDEIWIPDYESISDSLGGELSHGKHFHDNVKYLGPKSRLQKCSEANKKYDYLFLISGPEPQKTIFENLLINEAKKYPQLNFAFVTSTHKETGDKNINYFNSPDSKTLSSIICESKAVVCRSGYSTLMDMNFLTTEKLILVPTPGQIEQEYLAAYWKEKKGCEVFKQSAINQITF
jgi:hypothetical protein